MLITAALFLTALTGTGLLAAGARFNVAHLGSGFFAPLLLGPVLAVLLTGLLVILASRFGLPVSTTHVSVGAIGGVGLVNGSIRKGVIGAILASWLSTLPVAALGGATTYFLLRFFS